jgi:hypothetical protein
MEKKEEGKGRRREEGEGRKKVLTLIQLKIQNPVIFGALDLRQIVVSSFLFLPLF